MTRSDKNVGTRDGRIREGPGTAPCLPSRSQAPDAARMPSVTGQAREESSMSEQQKDFSTLMQCVREGSADATKELLDRYGPHVLRVVRRKLNRKLRPKFDSVDFVQDVWASFFTTPQQLQFDR